MLCSHLCFPSPRTVDNGSNQTITLDYGGSAEVYAQAKANSSASTWTTVGTVTVNAPAAPAAVTVSLDNTSGYVSGASYATRGYSYRAIGSNGASSGYIYVAPVSLTTAYITTNGTYSPAYYDGYSSVTVAVSTPSASVQFGSVRSRSVAAVGANVYVNYSLDGGSTWRSYTATVQEYTG